MRNLSTPEEASLGGWEAGGRRGSKVDVGPTEHTEANDIAVSDRGLVGLLNVTWHSEGLWFRRSHQGIPGWV
jgi:hypothetical protein